MYPRLHEYSGRTAVPELVPPYFARRAYESINLFAGQVFTAPNVPVFRSGRNFPHYVAWNDLLAAPESHYFRHGRLLTFNKRDILWHVQLSQLSRAAINRITRREKIAGV